MTIVMVALLLGGCHSNDDAAASAGPQAPLKSGGGGGLAPAAGVKASGATSRGSGKATFGMSQSQLDSKTGTSIKGGN
ncbi:MAG TPA: hypothetical protein VGL56_06035 [Fimbriimonadaceae bacterium]